MRSISNQANRELFANAASRANDNDDLPGELLFRRHSSKLCFFELPVLNIESFLFRKSDVLVDSFRASHDFDRAVVEFGSYPRLALVLSPRNHPKPRNQDNGWIRISYRWGIRMLVLIVISSVVTPVLVEASSQKLPEVLQVFALGVPIDVERFDFCAKEMIRSRGSKRGQARRVCAVDETQHVFVCLHGADEPPLLTHLSAQPRQQIDQCSIADCRIQRSEFLAAECRLSLVPIGNESRRPLDELETELIACLIIICPIDEAVLAEDRAFCIWKSFTKILQA